MVEELIEADEARRRERSKHQPPPTAGATEPAGTAQLGRYVNATIRRIVASVQEAEKGYRHRTLLNEAIALHSLTLSTWVPDNIRNGMDPQALLLPAAIANGYVSDRGEAEARRTIADGLKYAKPRPVPAHRDPVVPTAVYNSYTLVGTSSPGEPAGEALGAFPKGERDEIACLFPLPVDEDVRAIRPDTFELGMLRHDNPRRGASHLVISKAWANPSNAVYHRRILFGLIRRAFREHIAAVGSIYQTHLLVGTATEDDLELCKEQRREWDRLRKRLQRAGALYRWFSIVTEQGAFRVIFASEPLYDDQTPLEDSEATLLDVMRSVTSLSDPYPRRPAHGGPNDAWQPKKTASGDWVTVGTRPPWALMEMNQDAYDEAAAVANGVRTWRASQEEVNSRSPEAIMHTRHWLALPTGPPDLLVTLWRELGFKVSQRVWDRAFGDQFHGSREETTPDEEALRW